MRHYFQRILLALVLICHISCFNDYIHFGTGKGCLTDGVPISGEYFDKISMKVEFYMENVASPFPHSFYAFRNNDSWTTLGDLHFQLIQDGLNGKLSLSIVGFDPQSYIPTYVFNVETWYVLELIYDKTTKILEFRVNGNLEQTLTYTSCNSIRIRQGCFGAWNNSSSEQRIFMGKIKYITFKDTANGNAIITEQKTGCDPLVLGENIYQRDEDYWNGNCKTCAPQCKTCETTASNCLICNQSYNIANRDSEPICLCQTGYFEDGAGTCVDCEYKCDTCSYKSSQFSEIEFDTRYTTQNAVTVNGPFGNSVTAYEFTKGIRFGNENNGAFDTLHYGKVYQFSVYLKTVAGQPAPTKLEFDANDFSLAILKLDYYGEILERFTNSQQTELAALLSDTEWTRLGFLINMNDAGKQDYNFIDIGYFTSPTTSVLQYYQPQLYEVPNVYHTVSYDSNLPIHGNCVKCAHYTRHMAACECDPGYIEQSPNSPECHAPIPTGCQQFIRVEAAGLHVDPATDLADHWLKIFINDIEIVPTTPFSTGIGIIVLDQNDFSFVKSGTFNTHSSATAENDMATFITTINAGDIVLAGIKDEGAVYLTSIGLNALQSVGLSSEFTIRYRDSFALIGKKDGGLSLHQAFQKYSNGPSANIVACLDCGYKAKQCANIYNEYVFMKDVYQNQLSSSYSQPLLQISEQDSYGATGQVYRVTGKMRVGFEYLNNFETLTQGFKYRFSIWLRNVSGQPTTPTGFELDMNDRTEIVSITDQFGNILNHDLQTGIASSLTEDWQRFTITADFVNNLATTPLYTFIDIGQYSGTGVFEYVNPTIQKIQYADENPLPEFIDSDIINVGNQICSHYTRLLPSCDCMPGFEELTPGDVACEAVIPDTCSRFARVESATYNPLDVGNEKYARFYINDISIEATTVKGLHIVELDSNYDYVKTTSFDINTSSAENDSMVTYISSIPNDTTVLVAICDEAFKNLQATGLTALQSLGVDTSNSSSWYFRVAMAIIGKKGDAVGNAIQMIINSNMQGRAKVVKCLKGCDYQCSKCALEPFQCNSQCSHPTRENALCTCKDSFYDDGLDNAECLQCLFPCQNCDKDKCLSCDGLNRSTPSCLCDATFYYNGTDKDCVQCVSPCNECSDQTTCVSCVAGSNREAAPSCLCSRGYYDNAGNCEQCDPKCGSCDGPTNNDCIECADTNGRDPSKQCGCANGYYDVGGISCIVRRMLWKCFFLYNFMCGRQQRYFKQLRL